MPGAPKFPNPLSSSKCCEDEREGHSADEEIGLQEEQEAHLDLTPSLTTLLGPCTLGERVGMEEPLAEVILSIMSESPVAHSIQFTDDRQSGKVTSECAEHGIPPGPTAFWTEGGAALAELILVVVGTACREGWGRKVTRPPLTGHDSQDHRDPSQWPRDMASMALLSQGVMFWSL